MAPATVLLGTGHRIIPALGRTMTSARQRGKSFIDGARLGRATLAVIWRQAWASEFIADPQRLVMQPRWPDILKHVRPQ